MPSNSIRVQGVRTPRLFRCADARALGGAVLVTLVSGSTASAYIGSCGPADGYDINQYIGNVNWADVSYYNAGSYGANAGGGPLGSWHDVDDHVVVAGLLMSYIGTNWTASV